MAANEKNQSLKEGFAVFTRNKLALMKTNIFEIHVKLISIHPKRKINKPKIGFHLGQ